MVCVCYFDDEHNKIKFYFKGCCSTSPQIRFYSSYHKDLSFRLPDCETQPYYVSVSKGTNVTNCGSQQKPCKNIKFVYL
jgi:hypothetical protein